MIKESGEFLPRGGLGIFTDRDQRSIFLGSEFQEFVFFWVLVTATVFFRLLNKSCILKCFIFSTVFLWVQFYSPGGSIIMGLHYYHIMLDFCKMNSVFKRIFRVLLFGKYIFGFSVSGKVFFWVVQKYPTPLIPVCRFVKFIPWKFLTEVKGIRTE